MVAHFSIYGGGDKLHAPLATLLQETFAERNVAKQPKSIQIKIWSQPTASQKSQISGFWLKKSQSGNPAETLNIVKKSND